MIDLRTAPYGLFILRVVVGIMFLIHGYGKLTGLSGTVGYFSSLGLPGALAYVVMALEIVGGLALIFGVYARIFAVILAILLLGTIVTVHGPAGYFGNESTGGWEYPGLWFITMITLALAGDGKFALKPTCKCV